MVRVDCADVIQCLLFRQMRVQVGTCLAIQIAEIIELNKDIGHGCIGSRQRDELSADSIGVSLVGLPNIQQAVVVGVLNRGAQDHRTP